MSFTPSAQQSAIYRFIEMSSRSLIIIARAGAGKTTTILNALTKIPQTRRTIFLAFNKSIAMELKDRVRKGVECMTVNSLGHQALQKAFPAAQFDDKKLPKVFERVVTERGYNPAYIEANKDLLLSLVRYGKTIGITPALPGVKKIIVADTNEAWRNVCEFYGIAFKDEADRQMAFVIASAVLAESLRTKPNMDFDFDDQILMPVIYDLPFFKFDDIIIDEAQDISATKLQLILAALKMSGRVIAVGDDKQSIYTFAGAAPDSMENIKKATKAHTLYLSCTYRCAKKITAMAKELVPDIEHLPGAPEGELIFTGKSFNATQMKDKEMVVSRFNAPIMKLALDLLGKGVSFNYMGTDGKIEGISRFFKERGEETGKEIAEVCQQQIDGELAALLEAGENVEPLIDSMETAKIIALNFLDMTGKEISDKFKSVFSRSENKEGVKLCTIHKSKGLEAEKVYFLNSHDLPSRYAKKDWELVQEANLKYVAITRAKKILEFIAI